MTLPSKTFGKCCAIFRGCDVEAAVIESNTLDIVGVAMVVIGLGVLAVPIAFVAYVIYKMLDNR